jgi:hypothetical protein
MALKLACVLGGAELSEAIAPTGVLFRKNEKYTLWLKLSKKTHGQRDQAGGKT